MWRSRSLALLVALAACSTPSASPPAAPSSSAEATPPPAIPPAFAASPFPMPPRQLDPWQPSRTVEMPAPLVSAVEALFRAGLADPRGLEYRDVEIHTGSVWGDKGPVKTRAWVIPTAEGRFGVSWNGLVYPLVSVGAPQDLAADVLALIRADEEARAKSAAERPGHRFYRFRHAAPEEQSVSYKTMSALRVGLLLRLGEAKLARDLWAAWTAGMSADTNDDAVHLKDPYLMLATEWAWSLFDRAVTAHMRADDTIALASARVLAAIAPEIEVEADRRGFKPRNGASVRHLDFIAPITDLVADQERRAAEKAAPPPAPADPVAVLIRALDQVDARQWGQPGGVDLASDARVKALIDVGEPAVEPLLEVLERDTRLTRSVHFWRDFSTHRSILGVHEAAYVALARILQTSFFGVASTGDDLSARGLEGRREVAARVRAFWQKWRGVAQEERWYRVLADDASTRDQWLEAARNINQRGAALRNKQGPSVTELLVKRVDELGKRIGADRGDVAPLLAACTMAKLLGAWDAKGGARALARQMEMARDLTARRGDRSLFAGTAIRCVAELTTARVEGGDRAALDEYARWIVTISPEEADWYLRETVEPLWQNAGHRSIERAAETLFGKASSPWARLGEGTSIDYLVVTPLVRLGAFRRLVLRQLENRAQLGTVTVRDADQWVYDLPGGRSGGASIDKNDPHRPAPGTKHVMRVCDHLAFQLSQTQGAPPFRAYWPEAARDEALKAMIAFVTAQPR